jgi:glycyl-tRNA synthetase beta chain
MSEATLLLELFTEELPPKALKLLGEEFAGRVHQVLARAQLAAPEPSGVEAYATPRRLGMLIPRVRSQAADRAETRKLMPAKVAFDAAGEPTPALQKRLEKEGLGAEALRHIEHRREGEVDYAYVTHTVRGLTLAEGLQAALAEAIAALPIPKVMTYQLADGQTDVKFVRPAHGLTALHGTEVVPVSALGLCAGNVLRGHRFQSPQRLSLARAEDYERVLEKEGRVIASFAKRRAAVVQALEREARVASADPRLAEREALLDEVTALVEWPTVYIAQFEPEFLAVPPECLILTMQANQKYFPLFDSAGKLTNRFLIVSNMALANPRNVIEGNERVVRPRLADARFFFDQDRRTKLADRVSRLGSIVYHNKLGSQLDRMQRVARIAVAVAARLALPEAQAERAALLAKADLVTDMVGEFPELQGMMGRYYALYDGEDAPVADAIAQHYRPRFAGDALPDDGVPTALALADKLESLAGMFGIGAEPTGDKDPFGLRRAALGIIRILVEGRLELPLGGLLEAAFEAFPAGSIQNARAPLEAFVFERLRGYLRDAGYSANEVEAVLCLRPQELASVPHMLAAVRAFADLPEAPSLAAANKRVVNILKQADAKGEAYADADFTALREPAETALLEALRTTSRQATALFDNDDYTGYLKSFAVLKVPVDAFFDNVMVMVDDPALRQNRLGLLAALRSEMNRVADLSKLAS